MPDAPIPAPVPTPTPSQRIAIIGDGIAGYRLAEALAKGDNPPHIALFGGDEIPACNRPLLSKAYLSGESERTDLTVPLRNTDRYRVYSDPVTRIDLDGGALTTASNTTHHFDSVVLATGLKPRQLDLPAQSTQIGLTTVRDADQLTHAVASHTPITVIGGGMLALEAASSLHALGAAPTLITRDAHPLRRIIGDRLAARIAQRITASGITWIIDDQVAAPTPLTVTAIGSQFSAELLPPPYRAHATRSGIPVDAHFRSLAHPKLWVVGDAAIWPDGQPHPQWFSAMESARRAAAALRGEAPEAGWPEFVHSLWSDQWGVRIQCFGAAAGTPGLTEQEIVNEGDDVAVMFFDADGVVRGVAAISPLGAPSPAIRFRSSIGKSQDDLAALATPTVLSATP